MKKLLTLLAAVILMGSIFSTAQAAQQDNSFLYSATSGIFEENYDLFKFSPSYMPSFERNAFWGQLSNLVNSYDQIVANSASDYYLLGGHSDIVGLGRIGLMFDWYSYSEPQSVTPWYPTATVPSPGSHSGFGEFEYIEYQDRDSDEIMDFRRDVYSRAEETMHRSAKDIYVAYGLGGIAGFDVGAAIRGQWNSYQPTYYDGNLYGSNYGSFDWYGTETDRDLITGSRLYTYNTEGSGSLDYGTNEWRLILAGRSKDLLGFMPGMDLIVNIEPILFSRVNDLEWDFYYAFNDEPDNAAYYSEYRREITETGLDEGEALPGNGFGVGGKIRLDMETNFTGAENLKNRLIADINVEYKGLNIADAKHDERDYRIDQDMFTGTSGLEYRLNTDEYLYNYTWNGDETQFDLGAKVRALWLMEGWDFGLGIGVSSTTYDEKTTRDYTYTLNERYYRDNGVNTDDYTRTMTSGYKRDTQETTVVNQLELPLAIQMRLLSNFSVQLGASHTITITQSDYSWHNYDRAITTTNTVYDNGLTTYATDDTTSNEEANSFSTISTYHSTNLSYGVTWWPYEQVRIDLKGLSYINQLSNYRVSVNIYY